MGGPGSRAVTKHSIPAPAWMRPLSHLILYRVASLPPTLLFHPHLSSIDYSIDYSIVFRFPIYNLFLIVLMSLFLVD